MGHILSLIKQLSNTQIANFDLIIFAEEHICGFDISMQDLVLMQIAQTKAHLYEELPDLLFLKRPVHLLLHILADIAVLAILHNDVY